MKKHESEHIRRNRTNLINNIDCNTTLLATLQENDILSDYDACKLVICLLYTL